MPETYDGTCDACGREIPATWGPGLHSASYILEAHRAPCGQECLNGGLRPRDSEVPMRERIDQAHHSASKCPVCNPEKES